MEERKTFSKQLINSDAFLDMPLGCQVLYFHLGMNADDDGIVHNPKAILRMTGSNEEYLKNLVGKKFIEVALGYGYKVIYEKRD